jgi:hypothetical protein
MQNLLKKCNILHFILLYLICTVAYTISFFAMPSFVGMLTLIGETGMDILIFIIAYQLYNKWNNKNRVLFFLIGCSFLCEAFADGSYNIIQNVYGISNTTILISSFYEIPL